MCLSLSEGLLGTVPQLSRSCSSKCLKVPFTIEGKENMSLSESHAHTKKLLKAKWERKGRLSHGHSIYLPWDFSGDKFACPFVPMPPILDESKANDFLSRRHISNHSDLGGSLPFTLRHRFFVNTLEKKCFVLILGGECFMFNVYFMFQVFRKNSEDKTFLWLLQRIWSWVVFELWIQLEKKKNSFFSFLSFPFVSFHFFSFFVLHFKELVLNP